MAPRTRTRGASRRILPQNDPNWSQADQRRSVVFLDQHGREWHAMIEIKSGDPVGAFEPLFQAPLIPPQKYIRTLEDSPTDIEIRYREWARDIRQARALWDREARRVGASRYGEKYDPNAPVTREVMEVIGPPPEPVEPVIAARQGNSWVLGKNPRPDPRLLPYFTITKEREDEPDFRDLDEDDDEDFRDDSGPDGSQKNWRDDGGEGFDEDDLDELEESLDPGATGGTRADPRSARPAARAATRGTGGRKGGKKGKGGGKKSKPPKQKPEPAGAGAGATE